MKLYIFHMTTIKELSVFTIKLIHKLSCRIRVMEPVVQVEFYSTDDSEICDSKAWNRDERPWLESVAQQVELFESESGK